MYQENPVLKNDLIYLFAVIKRFHKFYDFMNDITNSDDNITSKLLFLLSTNGLNFKNFFNSFKVEAKEEEPKIRTFNLCIF